MAQSTKTNKKAAARRARTRATDVADRVRLGEDAYGVKKNISPAAWRLIVTNAHKGGFTVPGYLSDTPEELKPRLHSALKTQAQDLVKSAFAPQAKELDFQAKMADNLRARREEDARAYNQWASQQQSLSAAAATTAQQNYMDFIDKQQKTAQANADQLFAQANSIASQGINGNAEGTDQMQNLKQGLQVQAQAAQSQANAVHAAAPVNEERGLAVRASLQGQYNQINNAAEADYSKSLNDVTAGRLKLTSDQAQAVIDNYTKLLDKEVDKANATRDFQGLMAQLNEKTAARQQQHNEFVMGQKTTRRGQDISSATSKANAKVVAQTQKSIAALSHSDRVADRRQRALDNRLDRATKEALAAQTIAQKDRANTLKTSQANQKITGVIDTIADILRTQQRGAHGKPGSGYLWDADETEVAPCPPGADQPRRDVGTDQRRSRARARTAPHPAAEGRGRYRRVSARNR
jgi:hypothetical protein